MLTVSSAIILTGSPKLSGSDSMKPEAPSRHKKGVRPTTRAVIAAGVLQQREPKRRELRAVRKMGEVAGKSFAKEDFGQTKLAYLGEMAKSTAYWHGTGRFQRHDGKQVDVLQAILDAKAINPALDPFDPNLGLTQTTSLSVPRLYARAYADMHSDRPRELQRFISAQDAASFFVIRPALRHIVREARSHPDGFIAGAKESRNASAARQNAMPQSWKAKVTSQHVSTMNTFGAGSDIPGNYPILFGIDRTPRPIDTSEAIRETREVRVAEPITLNQLTHIEVPRERVEEVAKLFQRHDLATPVLAIEDMEQYMARQDIGMVLLGRELEGK